MSVCESFLHYRHEWMLFKHSHVWHRVGFFPSTFGDHAAKDEAQLFFFFFGILGFAGKKSWVTDKNKQNLTYALVTTVLIDGQGSSTVGKMGKPLQSLAGNFKIVDKLLSL